MRRLNALTVYLIMSGVTSLAYATIFTGLAVYYISQVGLSPTFESGALDAWLADELGEDRVGAAYARAGQVGQVAGLVGTGLSVGLSYVSLQLPVLLGGALFVGLGVFLALAMPETGFVP